MVARGDLGVELGVERVPGLQKQIIRAARKALKPVITATQMLESMIEHAQPTRAEASDVANAIWDGTDAVMLSAESASGAHPVEAVQWLARIAAEADANVKQRITTLPEDLAEKVSGPHRHLGGLRRLPHGGRDQCPLDRRLHRRGRHGAHGEPPGGADARAGRHRG